MLREESTVKAITDTYNEDKLEKFKLTYHRVGRRLTAMGFRKARAGDGASAVLWDDDAIIRMKESYGLRNLSETSETSDRAGPLGDNTEVPNDPDVIPYD